jgi:hypothetical protein
VRLGVTELVTVATVPGASESDNDTGGTGMSDQIRVRVSQVPMLAGSVYMCR